MKTSITAVLSLAALLGLAAGSAVASENWTKPQQEVADVIQAFAKANVAGNLDQMMSFTDPGFTAWDYSKPASQDRAAYRKAESEFYKNWTVLDCALTPTVIQLERDTAIVHGRHLIPVQSMKGAKRTMEGSWSGSLVRRDNQWRILSFSWVDDRPKVDEAAIKQEVAQALQGFIVACDRIDLDGTLGFEADVPEFRYADTDGQLYEYPAFKKLLAETFAGSVAQKVLTQRQEISVFGPDAALVAWHGSVELTQKDGTVVRSDPYNATFLFKRLGGTWRIVYQHESGLPPQPVKPAALPTPAATPK
jgi:ketosteroid isomerase-like protein